MNHTLKKLLSFALLFGINHLNGIVPKGPDVENVYGRSFFSQRSQGLLRPERLVGLLDEKLVRCDMECFNGVISVMPIYNRNFNQDQIAKYLFFNGTETMTFAGGFTDPANKDVNADNFILAADFAGEVTAKPRYQNAIIDIFLHFNLDEWVCGLYFEAGIPINWTKWELELLETTTNRGTNIIADQFGNATPQPAPVNTIKNAWAGQGVNTDLFPLLKDTMNFAKVSKNSETKTSVADITFTLGYNFLCCNDYHLGINARLVAPTGTRPDGEYFFEPVVGSGHNVMFGGGAWGHFDLWTNGCDQYFSVWFDGVVYHQFRAKQKRTFDYTKNGIGSRYLLLKKFNTTNPVSAIEEVVRGPNITTLDCKVNAAVTGQGTMIFDYSNCGFSFDVGYSIWGRSAEKIKITGEIEKDRYGIKGDTLVTMDGVGDLNTASTTKINGENGGVVDPNIVFIATEDLNPCSASHPSALSHTLLAHLSYTWEDCDYEPFLGFGGKAEFSGKGNRAFDIWAIWAKGGFTFS